MACSFHYSFDCTFYYTFRLNFHSNFQSLGKILAGGRRILMSHQIGGAWEIFCHDYNRASFRAGFVKAFAVPITTVFHRGNPTLHLTLSKVRLKLLLHRSPRLTFSKVWLKPLLHRNPALNAIQEAHQVIMDRVVVLTQMQELGRRKCLL